MSRESITGGSPGHRVELRSNLRITDSHVAAQYAPRERSALESESRPREPTVSQPIGRGGSAVRAFTFIHARGPAPPKPIGRRRRRGPGASLPRERPVLVFGVDGKLEYIRSHHLASILEYVVMEMVPWLEDSGQFPAIIVSFERRTMSCKFSFSSKLHWLAAARRHLSIATSCVVPWISGTTLEALNPGGALQSQKGQRLGMCPSGCTIVPPSAYGSWDQTGMWLSHRQSPNFGAAEPQSYFQGIKLRFGPTQIQSDLPSITKAFGASEI
ncbi:hypothetical protein C8R46DRAFT_1199601 [Mycena filopes]|nr:hypothetical protein C8R46DRAFT_1199601 [Mycena filopes]